MESRRQDPAVVVVGGGPAGLATALALTRLGCAVTVAEKDNFAHTRIGEHIGPAAVRRLRTMGLGDVLDRSPHFACSGIDAWWGGPVPVHNDYLLQPACSGLNLSRPRFDASLATLCRKQGVRILTAARLSRASRAAGGGWHLQIAHRGSSLLQHAAYVIDASGRAAAFARMQGAKSLALEKQIAIIGVATRSTSARSTSTRVVVEAARNGWWYFAPLAGGRCVCMLVTDPGIYARSGNRLPDWWRSELGATEQIRQCYSRYAQTRALLVRSAQSRRLDTLRGERWIAIGDAATTFDPLSSQGIAKALEQASAVSSAVVADLRGDGTLVRRLADSLSIRYEEYLAKRRDYYRLEQRWSDAEFWSARQ